MGQSLQILRLQTIVLIIGTRTGYRIREMLHFKIGIKGIVWGKKSN